MKKLNSFLSWLDQAYQDTWFWIAMAVTRPLELPDTPPTDAELNAVFIEDVDPIVYLDLDDLADLSDCNADSDLVLYAMTEDSG